MPVVADLDQRQRLVLLSFDLDRKGMLGLPLKRVKSPVLRECKLAETLFRRRSFLRVSPVGVGICYYAGHSGFPIYDLKTGLDPEDVRDVEK